MRPTDLRYRLEAARLYLLIGAFDRAARELARALELDADCADAHLELGRLAAWRGDDDDAEAHARRAPDTAAGHAILAGIAVLAGRFADADAHASRAIALDDGCSEAHVWRAEAVMRLGRYSQAHDDLTRGMMCADGFLLCAWILRLLINIEEGDVGTVLGKYRSQEIIDGLTELCPDARDAFASGTHEPIREVLSRGLAELRGNRSTTPTHVVDGELRRIAGREGPRAASRRALQSIRAVSPERAMAALDACVAKWPHLSLPVAHRGELKTWLGDLAGARADLERAIEIDAHTRWAYIGLSGIDLAEGNPEQSLATNARGVEIMGSEGPSVFIYRGEALRKLGRLDEAIADLERALAARPTRLSTRINRALAAGASGRLDDLRRAFDDICTQAPGLVSDAAREAGVEVWGNGDVLPATARLAAALEQTLAMMGGNRSSTCVTYFTREGRMRLVPRWDTRGPDRIGETERWALARARRLLPAAPRAHAVAVAPPPPRLLTPGEIESFVTRGYVVVRGCYSRAAAHAWVAGAIERIRDAPERWVKSYDPADPARDLRGFDPGDPRTWTWDRIDLVGDREVEIAAFAPRAWDAICDLAGGAARVHTRTWSTDLIANVSCQGEVTLESDSWHLDDPSRTTRLDEIRIGVIAVALLSDVAPCGGATLIAPESVPRVARVLADRPAGADFRDHTLSGEIMRSCNEIVELTGEVGDVALLHPLMLHSSSSNRSGKIRWMANPHVQLRAPLRVDRSSRADYSPVERAIVVAITQ
jgi:tetratricopeptide (TPR) repeat protein